MAESIFDAVAGTLTNKTTIRKATYYITPEANQYVQPYTHFGSATVTLGDGEYILNAFAQNGGGVPKPVGIVAPNRVTISSMSTEQITVYVFIAK